MEVSIFIQIFSTRLVMFWNFSALAQAPFDMSKMKLNTWYDKHGIWVALKLKKYLKNLKLEWRSGFSLLGGMVWDCSHHQPKFAHSVSHLGFLFSYSLDTQVMLILILIDVQYSQKAILSFEKGSNCQNHFSCGSLYPAKISDSKISIPHHPPDPYCYLENPGVKKYGKVDVKLFLYCPILLDFSILFQIFCLSL